MRIMIFHVVEGGVALIQEYKMTYKDDCHFEPYWTFLVLVLTAFLNENEKHWPPFCSLRIPFLESHDQPMALKHYSRLRQGL